MNAWGSSRLATCTKSDTSSIAGWTWFFCNAGSATGKIAGMFPAIPPATRALLLINVAVFLLQQVAGDLIAQLFALWPLGAGFRPWQLITYAFLHGSVLHIFFNMFALYMFGGALESYWGGRRLVLFYLVCVLTAALTQLAVQYPGVAEDFAPVIGASGGVFGVLLAF